MFCVRTAAFVLRGWWQAVHRWSWSKSTDRELIQIAITSRAKVSASELAMDHHRQRSHLKYSIVNVRPVPPPTLSSVKRSSNTRSLVVLSIIHSPRRLHLTAAACSYHTPCSSSRPYFLRLQCFRVDMVSAVAVLLRLHY